MRIGVEVNEFFGKWSNRVGRFDVEIEPGDNARKLLQSLSIPRDKVGFIIVNGKKRVDLDYIFSEGDRVHILPFATGG